MQGNSPHAVRRMVMRCSARVVMLLDMGATSELIYIEKHAPRMSARDHTVPVDMFELRHIQQLSSASGTSRTCQ